MPIGKQESTWQQEEYIEKENILGAFWKERILNYHKDSVDGFKDFIIRTHFPNDLDWENKMNMLFQNAVNQEITFGEFFDTLKNTLLSYVRAMNNAEKLIPNEQFEDIEPHINNNDLFEIEEYIAWGIDVLYSGTQKCLSCPPGLSPVTINERAFKKIQMRKSTVQSWFMDLLLVQKYWDVGEQENRTYHHTPPIHLLYALHESLILFHQEGRENVWQRHKEMATKLKLGLLHLGFEYCVSEAAQMPQLHVVIPLKKIREKEVTMRTKLLKEHHIEILAVSVCLPEKCGVLD